MCVGGGARAQACVRACERACVRASVHAFVRASVYVCMCEQHNDTKIIFQICFFRTALTSEEIADINDDPSVVYDM